MPKAVAFARIQVKRVMSHKRRMKAPRPPFEPLPPIRVYYPHGGRHFLLNWTTDHDRGHLLVARSEAALRHAFRAILVELPEILALSEVEIVAPSRRLRFEAAEKAYLEEVDSFARQVSWRLRKVYDKRGRMPAPFLPCDRYDSRYDDRGEELNVPIDVHYDCKNCVEGVRLIDFTKEWLHERFSERWRREISDEFLSWRDDDPKLAVSLAREAHDDEPVMAVVGNYGHHEAGVHIGEPRFGGCDPILFTFVLVRDPDPASYVAQVDALRAEREVAHERERDRRVKEMSLEEDKEIENVCRFFGGLT